MRFLESKMNLGAESSGDSNVDSDVDSLESSASFSVESGGDSQTQPAISNAEFILVGKLGKTHGVHGAIRFFILGDFPPNPSHKFFIYDAKIKAYTPIKMLNFNAQKSVAIFENFESLEAAKLLTNKQIYSTKADTIASHALGEDEFFYFELIGFKVVDEKDGFLGVVGDIERLGTTDYFQISHNKKTYLLPYIERYVLSISRDTKTITTRDTMGIIEAS